jgi:hypothetical protein
VLVNFGNHVRIRFCGEAIDDLPAAPSGVHAPERDAKAADEERDSEAGPRLRREERQTDGERAQSEVTPLFPAKVAKS